MWFFKKKTISSLNRPLVSVRMEAVGGQGANSAGKILAEAAVLGSHYTGNHFSSFGSEKRGSPVRSYVRFSPNHLPIRSTSSISLPDLLIVFHESLIHSRNESLEGTNQTTDLLLNTPHLPNEVQLPKGTQLKNIMTVDATSIARRYGCGINSVLLGASLHGLSEIKKEQLLITLEKFFNKLPKNKIKNNVRGFKAGYKNTEIKSFNSQQASLEISEHSLPHLGWLNAPIGGLVLSPGNTVLKDNSVSRTGIAPQFIPEACCHCGFCDMLCPDYCFVWEKDPTTNTFLLQGIDYQYCKGCQKCISICPVEALIPAKEEEIPKENKKIHLFSSSTTQKIKTLWKDHHWIQSLKELTPEGRNLSFEKKLLNLKTYLKPDYSEVKLPKQKKTLNKK
tara:strand:- start:411 stop:1589 length:1179 start_codon:yes stop_codon:yes gene_type:complete